MPESLEDEFKLITKNEPFLEKAGEGYKGIHNTPQYE
jgi:hypothetical protein